MWGALIFLPAYKETKKARIFKRKLLSTLLAVLLAVTMLTGMAIPAQAAENDIFNPGVLELDGSRTFTISKTKSSAFFSFTPETTGCYEFRIQNRKLKDVDVDFGIMDNYVMTLTSAGEVDAARYRGVSDTLVTASTLQAGERYLIYFTAYNQEQWERPVDFNVNVGMHTHDVIEGDIKATHYDDGENYKLCKYCDEYKGYMNDYNAYETVALSKTSYTYDGKEKKPGVTVTDWLGDPISKSEYTVTYPKSAKNVGKYTVTIKFKNHYVGTEKRTFTINPKGTSLSKVTSPKKAQLKVTWKKQATQTTGYQVQYSTDKNFKKGNKTVTVKGAKTTAKTISKLTKGKKYYVRVRTYKTVNKTNFYSGWSKSSSVTVKK